jgi:YegS/Rv2252/BmrU family lipid kinase
VSRRAVFVVNPASANSATVREWPELAARARSLGLAVEERMTEAPGHAAELAREASMNGADVVVAVGGDGTVHEVVNGLVGPGGAPFGNAALGVVARGTGRDFIRSHAIPAKPRDALRVIAEGRIRRVDLGEVATDADPEGTRFANAASAGVTGAIAARTNGMTKRLGGTPTFLVAAVQGFRAWRNTAIHVQVDGRPYDLTAACVVLMNGHSLAGGMKAARDARPDDGLLDVVLVGDVGAKDLALNLHRVYGGTLGAHPKIEQIKAAEVRVSGADPLPIEADGEIVGETPAVFRCLPGVLALVAGD